MNYQIVFFGLLTFATQSALAQNPLVGEWKYLKTECKSGAPYNKFGTADLDGGAESTVIFTDTTMSATIHIQAMGGGLPNGRTDCETEETANYKIDGAALHIEPATTHSTTCPGGDDYVKDASDATFEIVGETLNVTDKDAEYDTGCAKGGGSRTVYQKVK